MTTTSRYKLLCNTTWLAAFFIGIIPAAAQEPFFGLDLLNYLENSEQWPMFAQNQMNSATSLNPSLSPTTVKKLAPKWTFKSGGDVSARAAVVNGIVYFPDWATPTTSSNLWALAADSGRVMWSHTLSDHGLPTPTHSRTTPAVIHDVLYLGTQEGAWLLAIDAWSGRLIWKTELETADPYAIITTSPVVASGLVYTGIASTQEGVTTPGFTANARGSVVAVNGLTGKIVWKTYTLPDSGYAGAGVWGSSPVVDDLRQSVFIGTGNNYAAPTDPAYLLPLAVSAATSTAPVFTAQLVKTGFYVITGEGRNSVLRLTANGFILVDGRRPGNYGALLQAVQKVSYSEQPVRALILTGRQPGKGVTFPDERTRIIAHGNVKTTEPASRITFDSDYRVNMGGVDVQVFHFEAAHTNGDAVVYFPVQRVIAVGDLYAASPHPDYAEGGSLVNWSAVLREILKLDFDIVVPGTGPGVSRAELEAFQGRLDKLVSHARRLVKQSVPKGELLAELAKQDGGWRLTLNADQVDHFYRELSQAPGSSDGEAGAVR